MTNLGSLARDSETQSILSKIVCTASKPYEIECDVAVISVDKEPLGAKTAVLKKILELGDDALMEELKLCLFQKPEIGRAHV